LDNLVVVGSGGALYARWHGNAVNYLARLSKNGVNSLACGLGVVVTPDENGFAEFFYSGLTAGSYTLSIDQFFDSWGATAGTTVNRDIQVSAVDPNKYLPAVSAVSANNRLAVTWWGDDNSRVANIANHLGWRFILERQGPEQVNQCPAWVTVYDGPSMGVDDAEVKNGSSYKYRVTGIDPQLNIFTSPLPTTATFTPGPSFGTSPSGCDQRRVRISVE
jgi:hypothetical protein